MYKNLIATLCAFALFFTSTLAQTAGPSKTPLKVGFVYVTPRLPVGWVHQHELGRLASEQTMQKQGLQVQTGFVENVSKALTPSALSATWHSKATA